MIIRDVLESDLFHVGLIAKDSFDDYDEEDYKKMANNPNYKFWVAEKDGLICGFVIFLHIDTKIEIIKIATGLIFRQLGVASGLFLKVVEYMKLNNHEGIILEVNEKNMPAISFYEKMGMKPIFVREKYYHSTFDAIIMELKAI